MGATARGGSIFGSHASMHRGSPQSRGRLGHGWKGIGSIQKFLILAMKLADIDLFSFQQNGRRLRFGGPIVAKHVQKRILSNVARLWSFGRAHCKHSVHTWLGCGGLVFFGRDFVVFVLAERSTLAAQSGHTPVRIGT